MRTTQGLVYKGFLPAVRVRVLCISANLGHRNLDNLDERQDWIDLPIGGAFKFSLNIVNIPMKLGQKWDFHSKGSKQTQFFVYFK